MIDGVAGIERDPGIRRSSPRLRRAFAVKNARERHLVPLVARERSLRRAAHEHGAGHDRPARRLVERAQRAIAREDAEVGAARGDRLARGRDEAAPVAPAAHAPRSVTTVLQPARGIALARRARCPSRGCRARPARGRPRRGSSRPGAAPGSCRGPAAGRRAGLVQATPARRSATDLRAQAGGQVVLRVDEDLGFSGHPGTQPHAPPAWRSIGGPCARPASTPSTGAASTTPRASGARLRAPSTGTSPPERVLDRDALAARRAGSPTASSTRATTRSTAMSTAGAATSRR